MNIECVYYPFTCHEYKATIEDDRGRKSTSHTQKNNIMSMTKEIDFDDEPMSAREIDVDDDQQHTRDVDTHVRRECEGCRLPTATWKFYIRKFLCDSCRIKVPFKTIARSTAMKTFNLTWQELVDGGKYGFLQVFTVPNPHVKNMSKSQRRYVSPMRLYLFHEVQMFEKQLRKGLLIFDPSTLKSKFPTTTE